MSESIVSQISNLLAALDDAFVERQEQSRACLLALLSGHHVFLHGPPGTAKSLLARAIADCFSDARLFDYLLTRFSHPDELFGPVSIPGLKAEDFRRVTTGYLPDAHVAFVDEIFKANSAILNSLLTLINERVFHHGKHRDEVPLIGLIGASNELPDAAGGLGALYDRFLVRAAVPPIADDDAFSAMVFEPQRGFAAPEGAALTLAQLAEIRTGAETVTVPSAIREAVVSIRHALREAGVEGSDRRWRWAGQLLRTAAYTSGRRAVAAVDVLLLERCFGDPGGSERDVRVIVRRALESLVAPSTRDGLRAAWGALCRPSDGDDLGEALDRRLAAVERFESVLSQAEAAVDATREGVLASAASSPWVVDTPPRLVAGVVARRQEIARYREALRRYQERLEALDLYGSLMPKVRSVQLSSVGHADLWLTDQRPPPLWLCRPDDEPDQWVPISEEGLVLSGQSAAIAGQLQRAANHDVLAAGGELKDASPWHEGVQVAELNNASLYRLARRQESTVQGLLPEATRAMRAFGEWLRGVAVAELPSPPDPDGL